MKGSPTKIHNKLKMGVTKKRSTQQKSAFNLIHE